jgi:hypothetical protein
MSTVRLTMQHYMHVSLSDELKVTSTTAISVLLLVEPFVLVDQGKAVCKVKDFHGDEALE